MSLVFFFLKLKLKLLLVNSQKKFPVLLISIGCFLFIVYSYFFTFYLNKSLNTGIVLWQQISNTAYLFLIILVFVSDFFPKYYSSKEFVSIIYPLNSCKRTLIGLIDDFISRFYFVILLFLSVFSLFVEIQYFKKVNFFFCILFGIFSSHIVSKILRCYIERNFICKKIKFIVLLCIVFSLFIYFLFLNFFYNSAILNFLFASSQFGLLVLINRFSIDSTPLLLRSQLPIAFQLLTRNKQYRISITIMIITKITAFLFFLWLKVKSQDIAFMIPMILFTSPILVFTYLFNNFFGYFTNFLVIFKISHFGTFPLIGFFCLILFPIVLIDFIISLFLIWNEYVSTSWFLFYFSLIFLLTIVSFYLSIFKSKPITNAFSSSSNRPVINLVSFFPTLLATLIFIFKQDLIFTLSIINVLIGSFILVLFHIQYKKRFLINSILAD
jgi:hypothetical protein